METNWKNYIVYNELVNNLNYSIKSAKIKTRPNASCGLWMFFILPLSVVLSTLKLSSVSSQYRSVTFFCIDLIVFVYIFLLPKTSNSVINFKTILPSSVILLTSVLNNAGFLFNVVAAGFAATFSVVYPRLLISFPLCFTAGEGALLAEALMIFVFASGDNLLHVYTKSHLSDMEISTTILQIGLLGILLLCIIIETCQIFYETYKFYAITSIIILFGILTPMYLVLHRDPLLWMLWFLFHTNRRIGMLAYWVSCVFLAVLAIMKEVKGQQKANTSKRKIFHILGVAVFFPALMYECTLIYLASGVVLGIFIVLEIMRLLQVPPLGSALQSGFLIFVDEKDLAGGISLSPIYLLVGLSLPLWLHPYGCDVTDSAGFQLLPLMSGLLTVGVGDTAASAVGIRFGNHQWQGSKKTKEGTVGAILCQLACVLIVFYLGLILDKDIYKAIIAIIVTSLIEAKTDQMDNVVLPILAYMILV